MLVELVNNNCYSSDVPFIDLIQLQLLSLQVRPVAEEEMFKVLKTGKRKSKYWQNVSYDLRTL